MNCNTKFHNFWKNLDEDSFIPLTMLLIICIVVFYFFAFHLHVHHYSQEYDLLSCDTIVKKIDTGYIYNDGSHIYKESNIIVLKYKNKTTIYTQKISLNNSCVDIISDNPKHCKKDNKYCVDISLFGITKNSKTKSEYKIILY